jgi:hypothetical protein
MKIIVPGFSAAATMLSAAQASLNNPGHHGLSEVLCACDSGAGNDVPAFPTMAASMLQGGRTRSNAPDPIEACAPTLTAKRVPSSECAHAFSCPINLNWRT